MNHSCSHEISGQNRWSKKTLVIDGQITLFSAGNQTSICSRLFFCFLHWKLPILLEPAYICSSALAGDCVALLNRSQLTTLFLHICCTKLSQIQTQVQNKIDFNRQNSQLTSQIYCPKYSTLSSYFLKASDAGDISPPIYWIFRQILG